jgi:hypothetical protein
LNCNDENLTRIASHKQDVADYNALASNFSPSGYGAAAVPEPASVCPLLPGPLLLTRVRF